MKYLLILPLLLLASCSREIITTAHDLNIELVGTQAAYCIISTKDNRYALVAPGKTLVERDNDDLKIDCKDNLSDRRRTLMIESDFSLGYFSYPETVTVDFSMMTNGDLGNGYRAENSESFTKEILTEESYSQPVDETPRLNMDVHEITYEQDLVLGEMPIELLETKDVVELKQIESKSLKALDRNIIRHSSHPARKSYPIAE